MWAGHGESCSVLEGGGRPRLWWKPAGLPGLLLLRAFSSALCPCSVLLEKGSYLLDLLSPLLVIPNPLSPCLLTLLQ